MTPQNLISQQGWNSRPSGTTQIAVETCPLCKNTNWKFFINEESGLWDCKVCSESGNLYQLRQKLGLVMDGATSMKDVAASSTTPSPLPDLYGMHKQLYDDKYADVLDYLFSTRGFSMDVIERMKLGADYSQDKDGVMRYWYVIPYLDAAGNPYFYKKRNVPSEDGKKLFKAPHGREAGLFNESILKPGMEELCIVEGESDCLSLLSQGYESVVAVPGAAVKKAAWIEKLDKLAPKTIYIIYDNDKPGQDNAKQMAARIGLDRTRNVLLPAFSKVDGSPGKDLNEWFVSGKTLDDLRQLMAEAKPFDVTGVQSVATVLQELKYSLAEHGTQPKYDTPWPSLTAKVGGFEDGDVVGILAEAKIGKTTMALNMIQYYATKGYPSLMYCQEMPPKRMVRKWVSHVAQADDSPGASQITPQVVDNALEVALSLQGDILFGFTTPCVAKDVFETIRQAVRRYGVKVVCFDNLQMVVQSLEHSAQETSKITKQFKQLAMELGVLILLIIQPHRVADGQIVSSRNAMGSSAIEKDVDYMICLHRNRIANIREAEFNGVLDTEAAFDANMMVKVDLGRYAPGGITTLVMDGAKSTVREFVTSPAAVEQPTEAVPV